MRPPRTLRPSDVRMSVRSNPNAKRLGSKKISFADNILSAIFILLRKIKIGNFFLQIIKMRTVKTSQITILTSYLLHLTSKRLSFAAIFCYVIKIMLEMAVVLSAPFMKSI